MCEARSFTMLVCLAPAVLASPRIGESCRARVWFSAPRSRPPSWNSLHVYPLTPRLAQAFSSPFSTSFLSSPLASLRRRHPPPHMERRARCSSPQSLRRIVHAPLQKTGLPSLLAAARSSAPLPFASRPFRSLFSERSCCSTSFRS